MSPQKYDRSPFNSSSIDVQKLEKFQQWCQQNQIDAQMIVEKFIDACLSKNKAVIDFLNQDNTLMNVPEQIQFYLDESLKPLISRIEQLETQLDISSPPNLHDTVTTLSNSHQKKPPTEIDPEKITYIPRNEVWRRLKQTDYAKYAGYDSFIKARNNEFIPYGIFFDDHKKRFYILKEEEE